MRQNKTNKKFVYLISPNKIDKENFFSDLSSVLSSKKVSFDNVRINNLPNLEVQKFLDNFNTDANKILNKITFKNFVSDFIESYAG